MERYNQLATAFCLRLNELTGEKEENVQKNKERFTALSSELRKDQKINELLTRLREEFLLVH